MTSSAPAIGSSNSNAATLFATSTSTGKLGLTLKLPQLQNLCKRDPASYRDDYDAQIRRLKSECGILALSPSADPSPRLVELIQFAAAVSSGSYKGPESDAVADMLIGLLLGSSSASSSSSSKGGKKEVEPVLLQSSAPALSLHRDVRRACVSALILMRNKGAIPPLRLLELFFRLMAVVPDKALREILYRHVVNDVRNINKKGKRDEKVNRSVQSFLHRVVSSSSSAAASPQGDEGEETASAIASRRAVDMVCELYRRGVWTDEKTVAILASAAGSSDSSVMAKALRFFLNIEEKMAEDKARAEEVQWGDANTINYHHFSKKTSKRIQQVEKQVKNRKKTQHKRELDDLMQEDRGVEASKKLFPAIELLNNPQGVAETVFKRLKAAGSNSYKFETKLLMINFVTRLVGNHELLLLQLYPFLRRYMGGHQRDVTAILAYSVQACHQYVPPDEIFGLLKTISHNFVTERCTGEQMAVGINAAHAICRRVPSILSVDNETKADGEDDIVDSVSMDVEAYARDLAAYSKHRDRSVSIAGKTWTNFIREVHPSLLQGKDRGTTGSALHRAGKKPLRYGEQKVSAGVAGADLLAEYEAKKEEYRKRREERRANGIESESDDDSDGIQEEKMNDDDSDGDESGEWVDVEEDSKEGDDDSDNDKSGEWEDAEEDDSDDNKKVLEKGDTCDDSNDDVAPDLVLLDEDGNKSTTKNSKITSNGDSDNVNFEKMSAEEREKLQQQVSSTRVFSAEEFEKMRKLVERQERQKRDPRAAAKLKRAIARGTNFEALSDDDSDSSDDEDNVHIHGAVNPGDIVANARKKRMSKVERLEKIFAGRQKFEAKEREGGSTNTEKKRKKNFVMSKFSFETRKKQSMKGTARSAGIKRGGISKQDSKKRRRKF
mmetsp:Transcript_39634/g.59558  ORF Transcript_39634/g.59558 Transcript_39634/m.59558 type:complete len:894 (-) Transcript_39634:493-3174(-)